MSQPYKKQIFPRILAVLYLIIAFLITGCSGSGGAGGAGEQYQQKVYIIGEIKDPTSEGTAIKGVFVNRIPYDGISTDAPIFISADSMKSISEAMKKGISATYKNLNPIILILPNEEDVNTLLSMLGLVQDFKMPEGFAFLNMFAVDLEKGASFRWIMVPTRVSDNTPGADNIDNSAERMGQFRDWLSNNGSRITEKELQEKQKAVDALMVATKDDSKSDMENYVHGYNTTVNINDAGNTYQLSFWIYALHEFKTQADWFYVRQEAQFNSAKAYTSFQVWPATSSCGYEVKSLYIGKYAMDNYLNISNNLQDKYTQILRTSPDTTTEKTEIETGMDWEFSGDMGFEGLKPTGNVGVKVDIKNKKKVTIQDCQVYNKSNDSGSNAKWLYQFKEVTPIVYFGYLAFTDPSPLQIGMFAPQNHWLWRFKSEVRDNASGRSFTTKLTTDLIISTASYIDWFWTSRGEHRHYPSDWINYISLPYPPVLMADDYINITKAGQTKPIDLGVGRDWTASCDQPWCKVDPQSGNADRARVYLTADENTTGANRKAIITFKTLDGKGMVKTEVYQSQY